MLDSGSLDIPLEAGNVATLVFSVSKAFIGQENFFAIKAYDELDKESDLSNVATLTVDDIYEPSEVTDLTATLEDVGGQTGKVVNIEFTSPYDDDVFNLGQGKQCN